MRARVLKVIVVAGLSLLALAGCSASSGPEQIDSFDIAYTLHADGTVHAKETIHYDFGSTDDTHGIDRFLASRFETDTTGTDRVYAYSHITVSSPTGASALFSTSLLNYLQVRVGNANANVGGKQTYVLDYDITGALNRTKQTDGSYLDEFYWNATGDQWQIPIDRTTVTVTGPATIGQTACYAGPSGTETACASANSSGTKATFRNGAIQPGDQLTVDTGFPDGTFGATAPLLRPSLPTGATAVTSGSNDGPNPFWSPFNWGVGLLLLVGIPIVFRIFIAVRSRDQEFTGVTPGSIPADAATAPIGKAPPGETIIVYYSPPVGVPVGAANTILTKSRKSVDVTATMIDLAVRGYLTINEIDGANRHKASDYKLTATPEKATAKKKAARAGTPDAADLLPHESLLLADLFASGTTVSLSGLSNTFASNMRSITSTLDTWINSQNYFADKLNRAHPVLILTLLASILTFVVMFFVENAWFLIPVGGFVGSLFALRGSKRAARRSATGHALFLQLQGFKQYIATAEADQIRFEETDDVFSRYMPWAIAFGEADHWAGVFKQLAEEGKYAQNPDWYLSNGTSFAAGYLAGSMGSIASIGSAMNSFDAMASSTLTSTPSSSGNSGFGGGGFSGGGGGFSGGGGGGGGGGSW
jgi:uncharacterized membrane protein YgcG